MSKRTRPIKRPSSEYEALWRVVDGAVRDALRCHPEYIRGGIKERTVRESINKRVVGTLTSFIQQSTNSRS